ncbi:hypothetical protein [Tardiphaga sp. OK246]|uniref:hypothetical protein n=1 Tax=Tardiphaga sp. OK246 TaxID=1855307 RepID=UPI000B77A0A7|nr:hypothetical protein [Tardiphaga sp. OK246]
MEADDTVTERRSEGPYTHLLKFAQTDDDSSRIYNLIEILREFDQFTDEIELSVAGRCDRETLGELFDDFVVESLGQEGYWGRHTLWEIEFFTSTPRFTTSRSMKSSSRAATGCRSRRWCISTSADRRMTVTTDTPVGTRSPI